HALLHLYYVFPTRLSSDLWLDALPPAAAAVMAFMLLAIASLAITRPSTTMSGSTPPLIVVTPRRLIWPPPPGAPEFNLRGVTTIDRKSTRLNSSHGSISYA